MLHGSMVVAHNTVSLDGAYRDFPIDIGLHYEVAEEFRAPLRLIGSKTARLGLTAFGGSLPPEQPDDRRPPTTSREANAPYWAIVDSRGTMHGLLHALRSSGYCRDVIVLVAAATPPEYLAYLEARGYESIQAGDTRVDLRTALSELTRRHQVPTVLVDSGPGLVGALLGAHLVDRLSLITAPRVVHSERSYFEAFPSLALEVVDSRTLQGGHVHTVYAIAT